MKRSETDGALVLGTRTKRCACSSHLDFECHYFCHLDVIWVNTASKTTVYGLGGMLTRYRRSAGRCTCTAPNDVTCINFCTHRWVGIRASISGSAGLFECTTRSSAS
ncbi:endothelin-2 [Thalassophryne amazonica]|uniref:endothelin-2 n=1 Tax=Thalassophryne amazonica TaxID=390379 RepID=UPI001470A546|nr:endothelin-2 [Thalassophryne amazonica]